MTNTQQTELVTMLARVQRSVGSVRVFRTGLRGLTAGTTIGVSLLLVAHIWPVERAVLLALAIAAIGLLVGLVSGCHGWPSLEEAARIVDHTFSLHDRVTTTLQLRESADAIHGLQRADTARYLSSIQPSRCRSGQMTVRDLWVPAVAICIGATILLFGSPAAPSSASQTSASPDVGTRQLASTQLPILIRQVSTGDHRQLSGNPALTQLRTQLELLRHALSQSQSRTSALRAVSLSQQQMRAIARSLHPVDRASIAALNHVLAAALPSTVTRTRLPETDPKATSRELDQLARELRGLSALERQKLTQGLKQSAKATNPSSLRADLRNAASALANNDTGSARLALKDAAKVLAETPNARQAEKRVKEAVKQLGKLKRSIASQRPQQASGAQNRPSGARSSSGTTSGTNARAKGAPPTGGANRRQAGTRGGGQAGAATLLRRNFGPSSGLIQSAGSSNARQVTGTVNRRSGEGGHVTDAPNATGSTTRQGKFIRLYIAGRAGQGPHIIQISTSSGSSSAQSAAYRRILATYSQGVAATLGRQVLPPSVETYVRKYFVVITR